MCRRPTLLQRLFSNVDIAMLVYFRIVFGLTVFAWAATSLLTGRVLAYYVDPPLHFSYAGFGWIEPLAGDGMWFLFLAIAMSALAVVLGCLYRLTTFVVAAGFTYVFLIDKVCYLNHCYLICLVSWIMVVVPSHRAFSVDALLWPKSRRENAPAWSLALLRFQIAVPYFFGGIAKLDSDWLRGQPLREVLAERASMPLVGPILAQEWATWFFSYGGMLFDVLIVPALLWRRTRPWAFGVAVVFHVTNSQLFTIGVFPWFMILGTVLFFPADFPRRLLPFGKEIPPSRESKHLPSHDPPTPLPTSLSLARRTILGLLLAFVVFQSLWPLRHLTQFGNANWTEVGHRFAWHMMLRGKRCGIRYYVFDPSTGSKRPVGLRPYLTEFQVTRFGRDPDMIRQLGQFLAEDLRRKGHHDIAIHALAWVSLNGRKPQLMVDPAVDLSSLARSRSWGRPAWVVPLSEPLRHHAWDVPLDEWEKHLELPPNFTGSNVVANPQREL